MLAISVMGSLLYEAFSPPITPEKIERSGVWRAIQKDLDDLLPDEKLDAAAKIKALAEIKVRVTAKLANMFVKPRTADAGAAYESRVLHGIWATAPYLHNGSVPNLWELMLPPRRRAMTFKVGSRKFDPKTVGYATDESPYKSSAFLVDPQNLNGNGNSGHDYTSDLSDDDRWALVEYLKTL
jgi:hypothetical protein